MRLPGHGADATFGRALATGVPDINKSLHDASTFSKQTTFLAKISVVRIDFTVLQQILHLRSLPQHGRMWIFQSNSNLMTNAKTKNVSRKL